MLNAEDVQNTGEQWLLNLLINRIIYADCSHKEYQQGRFSSLLTLKQSLQVPPAMED